MKRLPQVDESRLIDEARSGSAGAFCRLIAGHRNRLYRFLLTRCDSYADAEDAVQEAVLNAYRYLGSYNPKWRFSTWLYRIAIRELGALRQPGPGVPGDSTAADEDPLSSCIRASERDNLWITARHCLSGDQFNALWLRYAEDLSVKEVAHALSRSVPWTKVTLHRSRRRLGGALKTEALEGPAAGRHLDAKQL